MTVHTVSVGFYLLKLFLIHGKYLPKNKSRTILCLLKLFLTRYVIIPHLNHFLENDIEADVYKTSKSNRR